MRRPNDLLPYPLGAEQVRSYIDFDGGQCSSVPPSPQAELQSKGVAALWHLLQTRGYAYLGDEVGMGKTRQALAVIATQFLHDPESHVVVVCPGRPLQLQWQREWNAFIRSCYKVKDNRLISSLDGRPAWEPETHERLRDFARALLLNESRIHLLRYSSFSRPIRFGEARNANSPKTLFREYETCLKEIGIGAASAEEIVILEQFTGRLAEDWRETITRELNEAYAKRVGQLLKARSIDLIVFDEAQYLRHLGNRQNTNIRHVARTHAKKWLFVSATPLHTGPGDVRSLDAYLCSKPKGPGDACAPCSKDACTHVSYRLDNKCVRHDVVDLLREFMVRRPRTYPAGSANLTKVQYRKYARNRIDAASDPFLALTMALVQKRLVMALAGNNNRFRQGECSSFESLSASVKRAYRDRDGNPREEREYETTAARGKGSVSEQTPDRASIDDLNRSFRAAMLPEAVDSRPAEGGESAAARYNMPHGKLRKVAKELFERNLRDGANHKTLVFVRRLDTVDELVALGLSYVQVEVDERLSLWQDLLGRRAADELREPLWSSGRFWAHGAGSDDVPADEGEAEEGDTPMPVSSAGRLEYFEARRSKRSQTENGMLVSFHSRLLREPHENPLRGFLLVPRKKEETVANPAWRTAEEWWERLVKLILAKTAGAEGDKEWLVAQPGGEVSWKLVCLKRCVLQSLRQTDFLVDLYVLNRFLKGAGNTSKEQALPEKLLWFLGYQRDEALPGRLEKYVENWRLKLRLWFDHFDLIVDKCLRGGRAGTWQEVYGQIDQAFVRMFPVLGRSGRLEHQNAVRQFQFPVHPNILICTDVLKEGVDMHLFCDEVVHYGVAWTSGDLEQRIGRVDRYGSLISRKLVCHGATADDQALPRLQVQFPFLDGTLDRYQVDRVIVEKIKSDHRLDLGKREDDFGFISLDQLEADRSSDPSVDDQLHCFYPPDVPQGGSAAIPDKLRLRSLQEQELPCGGRHLPHIQAICLRRRLSISARHGFDRITRDGRRPAVVEAEYLIPTPLVGAPAERFQAVVKLMETDLEQPVAVRRLSGSSDFRLCPGHNTLVQDVRVEDPFAHETPRSQRVLLEKTKHSWVLRTAVCSSDARLSCGQDAGLAAWLATQNALRSWGYLASDGDVIWFVVRVLDEKGDVGAAVLERLGERVGKTGDRLQHLYTATDASEGGHYRARLVFPQLKLSEQGRAIIERKDRIMKMSVSDLQDCGQLLAGVQEWFEQSFHRVLNRLYGDVPEGNRGLEVTPVMFLDHGVLQLSTVGAERFALQAFLQLHDPEHGVAALSAPRIVWELAASPNTTGPKPALDFSDWEELSPINLDYWDGEDVEGCAAYSFDGEKYRYLAVYHSPATWDSLQDELLEAWSEALNKMRVGVQWKKRSRDLFLKIASAKPTITQQTPPEAVPNP